MSINHSTQVDVAENCGVGHNNQFILFAVLQEGHGVVQGLQLTAVGTHSSLCEGSQELQTALFQFQAPLLTVADVVQQGLIVLTGDDADVLDAGTGQVGQSKVHLTVTATEGNAGHGTLIGQLTHGSVVGKDNTHYVHC